MVACAAAVFLAIRRNADGRMDAYAKAPAPMDLGRRPSAANLKFLSVSRQARDRNFKFKAATQINKLLEPL